MTLTELIEAIRNRSPGAMELMREITAVLREDAARRIEARFREMNARMASDTERLKRVLEEDAAAGKGEETQR